MTTLQRNEVHLYEADFLDLVFPNYISLGQDNF